MGISDSAVRKVSAGHPKEIADQDLVLMAEHSSQYMRLLIGYRGSALCHLHPSERERACDINSRPPLAGAIYPVQHALALCHGEGRGRRHPD